MYSQKLFSFLKDPKTILNYYNFMAYKQMCFWKLKFMVPSKVNCSLTMYLSQLNQSDNIYTHATKWFFTATS